MSLSRHQRPTCSQQEILVQFLEENPGIAKGNLRTAKAKWATKKKWCQLAVQLNSIGGVVRDGRGWAKYWADKKYLLKRHLAQNSSLSDAGIEQAAEVSDLEQRMIAVMNDGDPLKVKIKKYERRSFEEPQLSPTYQEESTFGMTQASSDPLEPTTSDTHIPKRLRPVNRSQTNLNREKHRLMLIEERRVEAELMNARTLRDSVNSINNLAEAIRAAGKDIANAISSFAHFNK